MKELWLVVISSTKWKLHIREKKRKMDSCRSKLMEWKDSFNYFFLSHFVPFPWHIISVIFFVVVIVASFTWSFLLSFKGEVGFYQRFIVSTNCSSLSISFQILLYIFSCRGRNAGYALVIFSFDARSLSKNLNKKKVKDE